MYVEAFTLWGLHDPKPRGPCIEAILLVIDGVELFHGRFLHGRGTSDFWRWESLGGAGFPQEESFF